MQLQHAFVPTENNIISPDKLRNQLMISMKGYAELKKRGMLESTFRDFFDYSNYRVDY